MIIKIILSVFIGVHASTSNIKDMKQQVDNLVQCRINLENSTPEKIQKSLACYMDKLSPHLSSKEQAGISYWIQNIDSVEKIWSCDTKKFQLYSYSRSTKNFICVQVKERNQSKSEVRIFFFDVVSGKYLLNNIYKPINWE